ncbi:prolyl oligopeptidase family serine peptidase [uncultured Sphingomonas sp.]|uniref:prolyl oligopeptidase family serine peptidase n=1 Tax=uncultured Sphingomonas sp. TaxID=158754 RepID=UPI0030D71C50
MALFIVVEEAVMRGDGSTDLRIKPGRIMPRTIAIWALLAVATLPQHFGLARAVVSAVGIDDMIRSEQDVNGAFNIPEYGTVTDPARVRAIHAYLPYQHVVPGNANPAVLMPTGANDGRVNPLQSRKSAAALQAAPDHPILLRTSDTSGHGIGSPEADRNVEATDQLMFLFDQLGVTLPR